MGWDEVVPGVCVGWERKEIRRKAGRHMLLITITAGDMGTSYEEVAEEMMEDSARVVGVVSGMTEFDKPARGVVVSYSSELDIY